MKENQTKPLRRARLKVNLSKQYNYFISIKIAQNIIFVIINAY